VNLAIDRTAFEWAEKIAKMLNFDNIYRENRSMVLILCQKMTRNPANAEDLAQEVFLKVWRKLPQFRGDCALSTWIYTIARREVLMSMRGLEAKAEHVFNYPTLHAPRISPELKITLARAVAGLPKKRREDFIGHHILGFEYQELAVQRKTKVSATKSSCLQARRQLKKILAAKERIRLVH